MTATDWSNQAQALVNQALTAAKGKDVDAIILLEASFLDLKQQELPDVPDAVDATFRNAMFALNDALVGNVVSDWDGLRSDLEASAAALGGIAAKAKGAAALLSLQPVTGILNSLTAIVNDVKNLKSNPTSADNVAQQIQNIAGQLQSIITTATGQLS